MIATMLAGLAGPVAASEEGRRNTALALAGATALLGLGRMGDHDDHWSDRGRNDHDRGWRELQQAQDRRERALRAYERAKHEFALAKAALKHAGRWSEHARRRYDEAAHNLERAKLELKYAQRAFEQAQRDFAREKTYDRGGWGGSHRR
jgi:hypothetical protein